MAMLLWADIFLEYLHQCCPSSKHLMVSSFAGGSSFCMQFLTTKSYFTIMKNEEQENCRRGIGDLPALPLIPKHQFYDCICTLTGPFRFSGQNLLCGCCIFYKYAFLPVSAVSQDQCGHGRGAGCNRSHGMPGKAAGEARHVKQPQSSGLLF